MPPPQPPVLMRREYAVTLLPLSHLTQSWSGLSLICSIGLAPTQLHISRRSELALERSPRPYASEWKRHDPSPGCRITRALLSTSGVEQAPIPLAERLVASG